MIDPPFLGCDGCTTTLGPAACPLHSHAWIAPTRWEAPSLTSSGPHSVLFVVCAVLGREGCPQHAYAGLEATIRTLRAELLKQPAPFCGWCGHLRHDRPGDRCWANVGGSVPEPCGCDGLPEEDQP